MLESNLVIILSLRDPLKLLSGSGATPTDRSSVSSCLTKTETDSLIVPESDMDYKQPRAKSTDSNSRGTDPRHPPLGSGSDSHQRHHRRRNLRLAVEGVFSHWVLQFDRVRGLRGRRHVIHSLLRGGRQPLR